MLIRVVAILVGLASFLTRAGIEVYLARTERAPVPSPATDAAVPSQSLEKDC